MRKFKYEFLARMASKAFQERWIDKGSTVDGYVVPEEILNDAFAGMKKIILENSDDPLKERVLNLYVYSLNESEKCAGDQIYESKSWKNIREATRGFLEHLTNFDLAAWEKSDSADLD